jgi:hypothetical protein
MQVWMGISLVGYQDDMWSMTVWVTRLAAAAGWHWLERLWSWATSSPKSRRREAPGIVAALVGPAEVSRSCSGRSIHIGEAAVVLQWTA